MGKRILLHSFFDSISTYYIMSYRWYVTRSDIFSSWSSIFGVLSGELWLILNISIAITAISTTLVGRYSCTSEWQQYKTLTNSLTRVWTVILRVSVSTMSRTLFLHLLFLAGVYSSLAFTTVFQAFLTSFLNSGYKTPIQNMDELFASGVMLSHLTEHGFIFENVDETEALKYKEML